MAVDTATVPRERSRRLAAATWVLRQQRRALVLWSLAVGAVSAIYASFWAALGDPGEFEAMVAGMPEGLVTALGYDTIGTPAGYLESTVYGLLGPVLLLVFGITLAARVIAGDEEEGTLELELSLPASRRRVLLERYLALVAQVAVLTAVVLVVVATIAAAIDMGVELGGLAATSLGLFLLTVAISTVAFAVGAATGRRAIALATGAAVGVLGFVSDALAPLLDEGDWLAAISPFSWYLGGSPLTDGVDPIGFGMLTLLTVVALAIGVARFDRRDLGV